MYFVHFLVSSFSAVILSLIFSRCLLKKGPWTSFWVFFTVTFLASLAGGEWLSPFGPPFLGVYWMSFFVAGLISALSFAIPIYYMTRRPRLSFWNPRKRNWSRRAG